jgi:hypothetical protein
MEKTKEVVIKFDDQDYKVIIKRMTLKERNDVLRQSMTIRTVVGSEPIINIDPHTLKEVSIQKCIIEAPFKTDPESLDFELGDLLYKEIEKLNSLTAEKKES